MLNIFIRNIWFHTFPYKIHDNYKQFRVERLMLEQRDDSVLAVSNSSNNTTTYLIS